MKIGSMINFISLPRDRSLATETDCLQNSPGFPGGEYNIKSPFFYLILFQFLLIVKHLTKYIKISSDNTLFELSQF